LEEAFEEIAARTGLKSALDLDIAVERRKYNYARIWKLGADCDYGRQCPHTPPRDLDNLLGQHCLAW
jgi:hypothetical protein